MRGNCSIRWKISTQANHKPTIHKSTSGNIKKIDRRNFNVINNSFPVQDEISFSSHFLRSSPPFSLAIRRSKGEPNLFAKGFSRKHLRTRQKSSPTPPKYLIPFLANWTVLLRDAYFRWRFYYVYWERSAFSPSTMQEKKKRREKQRIAPRDCV